MDALVPAWRGVTAPGGIWRWMQCRQKTNGSLTVNQMQHARAVVAGIARNGRICRASMWRLSSGAHFICQSTGCARK